MFIVRNARQRPLFRAGAVLTFAAVLLIGVPASAETLQDAVRAGLTNPEVREAAANRRSFDHQLREARALYYPSVDLRGATGPEWTDSPNTRTAGDNGHWLWRNEASATLTQMIFDGYDTHSQVARQAARARAAAARVIERSEFIALDIAEAYLNILRQFELVRFAEENVSAHVSTLDDVRERVEAGRSGVGDQRQADSRLAQARADLVEARRALDDARVAYQRLVGSEPIDLTRPVLPEAELPQSIDAAVSAAMARNPSIGVARLDMEAAHADIGVADAAFMPRINLEVTGTKGHNIAGQAGRNDSFSAMLVARWNLYRGGGDTARRLGAIERRNEAQERVARFDIQAQEEARRSWYALIRQREQVAILRDRVTAADGVLDAYRQQFDVGQRDLLDVLDSQNDVFLARSRLATADYATQFAGYRLLALSGGLLASLEVEDPDEGEGGRVTREIVRQE